MVIRRFHVELAAAGLICLVGAAAAFGSLELGVGWGDSGPEPGYFPFYVGVLLMLFSVWNGAYALVAGARDQRAFLERRHLIRLARFFAPMAAFVVVTIFMGLYVGAALYLFYVAWRQGGYRPHWAALMAAGFAVALFFIFEVMLKVPLLKGPIEPLLGVY
jgi:hypothetical protein